MSVEGILLPHFNVSESGEGDTACLRGSNVDRAFSLVKFSERDVTCLRGSNSWHHGVKIPFDPSIME